MPNAHFKEFTGLAPRIRGESSNAKVCDNVDLYGRTLRPHNQDTLISEPKRQGKFVRVEGNLHFIPDAVEAHLQTFKGYYVILYKTSESKGSKWYKKVFEDPSGTGAITTEVSFPAPVLPTSYNLVDPPSASYKPELIRGVKGGVRWETFINNSVSSGVNAKNNGVRLAPDTYKYSIEAIDGEGNTAYISPEWDVLIDYAWYWTSQKGEGYIADLQENGRTISGLHYDLIKSSTGDKTYQSPNTIAMLYGYLNGGDSRISSSYGYADPSYTTPTRYVSVASGRGGRGTSAQTTVAVPDPSIAQSTDPSLLIGNSLTTVPRWIYEVQERSGMNYAKLSKESIDSILNPNWSQIQNSGSGAEIPYTNVVSTYNSFGRPELESVTPFGNTRAELENKIRTLDSNEVTLSGFGVTRQGIVVEYKGDTRIRMVNDDGSIITPYQEGRYVYGVSFRGESGYTYRLRRRSASGSKTFIVAESIPNSSNGAVILRDDNKADANADTTESVTVQEKTYRYVVTFSRLAGVSNDIENWEEESGPSEEASVTVTTLSNTINRPKWVDDPNSTVSLIGKRAKPTYENPATFPYENWNIYRLTEGIDGTTEYQLVAQVPKTESSYLDTIKDTELGPTAESMFLADEVPYQYGSMPTGLHLAPSPYNGMQFGWKDGQVYWTDRYYLSGWVPETFNAEMPYPVVGMVPLGNALTIVTTNAVYRAVSSGPTDFSFVESPSGEGGIRGLRESVIPSDKGVIYLSDSGIHIYDGVRSTSITDNVVGEEYFRTDIDTSSAIMRENDGILHLFHANGVLLFDMRSKQISEVSDVIASQVFKDHESGSLLYMNQKGQILELFSNTFRTRSQRYRTGEIHFGMNGRKRVKFVQFLGTGVIQCVPYINGSDSGLKGKLVNMDGMENHTRMYFPANATLDSLELEISGTGEVKEFLIQWERL